MISKKEYFAQNIYFSKEASKAIDTISALTGIEGISKIVELSLLRYAKELVDKIKGE